MSCARHGKAKCSRPAGPGRPAKGWNEAQGSPCQRWPPQEAKHRCTCNVPWFQEAQGLKVVGEANRRRPTAAAQVQVASPAPSIINGWTLQSTNVQCRALTCGSCWACLCMCAYDVLCCPTTCADRRVLETSCRKEHKEAVLAKKLALKKNYSIIHVSGLLVII